jgi:hypothetical protein
MKEVFVKGYTRNEKISSAERKKICENAVKERWRRYYAKKKNIRVNSYRRNKPRSC